MIQGSASHARIVGMFLMLGLASSVYARTDTSRLHYEVRPQGAPSSAWTTDLRVAPGTIVEYRALVTYTGTSPAVGLAIANFQPTVSHWDPTTDTLEEFRRSGLGSALGASWSANMGSVVRDSGEYGRIYPYGGPGINTTNALRGHTNNVVNGVQYLRIAQAMITNWAGVGPTSGTASNNNFNGASGLALGQPPPSAFGTPNAYYVAETQDVEIARFAIMVGGNDERVMQVSTPAESVSLLFGGGIPFRGFAWHRTLQSDGSDLVRGGVTIEPAFIRVPTPGAIALLGMGGVIAARRRRP